MANSARENMPVIAVDVAGPTRQGLSPLRAVLLVVAASVALLAAALAVIYQNSFVETAEPHAVLVESTLGQLALWMVEQSTVENPEAILGQYAKQWAASLGQDTLDEATTLAAARSVMVAICALIAILSGIGTLGLFLNARWTRAALLTALLGLDTLIFLIPWLQGDSTLGFLLAAMFLLLIALFFSPGKVTKLLGFMVVLSALLMSWEVLKAFGAAANYQITLPQSGWTYQTYETVEQALAAVQAGEIAAAVVDENDVEDTIPPYPEGDVDASTFAQPGLRILTDLQRESQVLSLPVRPEFPGRLAVVTRSEDAANWNAASQLVGQPLGTLAGDFADEKFLALPRNLVLLDLKITNDLNMPHLQNIAEALLQPARRQGPVLLVRILSAAALFTWSEAAIGFTSGALLGFLLGALFAHSRLMERGLLPYVVMSQTVPILAIAPIVV
ncbi:MAG: hypothetical protein K8I30_06820, partial [Anaerolineae bacterium]|nr:hypothetical protein [Anaerolineae bacterium]